MTQFVNELHRFVHALQKHGYIGRGTSLELGLPKKTIEILRMHIDLGRFYSQELIDEENDIVELMINIGQVELRIKESSRLRK